MSPTWSEEPPPQFPKFTYADILRIALRLPVILLILLIGLAALMSLRLFEIPVFGRSRPASPYVTQAVCRLILRVMGLVVSVQGRPLNVPGAMVANHCSWMDIFALNSRQNIYFVSKSEVRHWPGIGLLARATGTLFITRNRKDARQQIQLFRERLLNGHRLLFFPEGTSSDGLRVLPFKTTLFAAFFDSDLKDEMAIQGVALRYHAPEGTDPRFYGWWGDMEFAPSLLRMLAARHHGHVQVSYCAPLTVGHFNDRKALAAALEAQVREAHATGCNTD